MYQSLVTKIQILWQKERKNKLKIIMKILEIWDKIAGEIIDDLKKKKQTALAKKIMKIETKKKYECFAQYIRQSKIDFIVAKEKWNKMQKEKNVSKENNDLDLEKVDEEIKEEKLEKETEEKVSPTSQKESKKKVNVTNERRKTQLYKRQKTIRKKDVKKEVKKKSAKEIWANLSKPVYSPIPKEETMKEMIFALASKM